MTSLPGKTKPRAFVYIVSCEQVARQQEEVRLAEEARKRELERKRQEEAEARSEQKRKDEDRERKRRERDEASQQVRTHA